MADLNTRHLGTKYKAVKQVTISMDSYNILLRQSSMTDIPVGRILDMLIQHNYQMGIKKERELREQGIDTTQG